MAPRYPSDDLKKLLLRIPNAMRERLETAAAENGRSLTAEVLARVESTFPKSEAWLSRMQQSPAIRQAKELLAVEARLEGRLDAVEDRLAALEAKAATPEPEFTSGASRQLLVQGKRALKQKP